MNIISVWKQLMSVIDTVQVGSLFQWFQYNVGVQQRFADTRHRLDSQSTTKMFHLNKPQTQLPLLRNTREFILELNQVVCFPSIRCTQNKQIVCLSNKKNFLQRRRPHKVEKYSTKQQRRCRRPSSTLGLCQIRYKIKYKKVIK